MLYALLALLISATHAVDSNTYEVIQYGGSPSSYQSNIPSNVFFQQNCGEMHKSGEFWNTKDFELFFLGGLFRKFLLSDVLFVPFKGDEKKVWEDLNGVFAHEGPFNISADLIRLGASYHRLRSIEEGMEHRPSSTYGDGVKLYKNIQKEHGDTILEYMQHIILNWINASVFRVPEKDFWNSMDTTYDGFFPSKSKSSVKDRVLSIIDAAYTLEGFDKSVPSSLRKERFTIFEQSDGNKECEYSQVAFMGILGSNNPQEYRGVCTTLSDFLKKHARSKFKKYETNFAQ